MDLKNYSAKDFDRGASTLKEALWHLTKIIFFLSPLPFPSSLKVSLLRIFGARVGDGVVIRPRVNITFPWRLQIGDYVWIGEEVLILSLANVTIDSNVCISQRAFLCTGSHDYRAHTFDLTTKPITIKSESWVAAQAFVGPGSTIQTGAIIGPGSVLLGDAEANCLMLGNPATVSKSIR